MDIVEYKCPNCSADLKFNPTLQKLTCEYCGGAFTVEEIKKLFAKNESALGGTDSGQNGPSSQEADSQEEDSAEGSEFAESTKLYHCSSCGAEIMATDQQTALFCYYCHNPVILSGKMTGKYRPKKIIGFKISREDAVKKFRDWCFKPFVPKDFKTEQQLEKITGLYVPFWIADCNVAIDYEALGKEVHRWTSGNYDYTQTKEYNVRRSGNVEVDGIPADGSERIDDKIMEAIEPFDYSELQDFSMSYLSGFYAEKFDVDKEAVLPRIKERLINTCKKILGNSLTQYSALDVSTEEYNIASSCVRYAMMPVWFMSYKYKDEIYEFVLNGQTGKIAGTPPIAEGKLRLFTWGIAAACTVAVYAIGALLLGGMF
ncbi:MAG: hypothetical protein K6G00_05075 [Treponema sp.]|nr:hypothetical protein [Treponema sp.]